MISQTKLTIMNYDDESSIQLAASMIWRKCGATSNVLDFKPQSQQHLLNESPPPIDTLSSSQDIFFVSKIIISLNQACETRTTAAVYRTPRSRR